MTMTSKKKRNLTIILSVVLVAAIAIGITMAYLFTQTEAKNNVFTFADNITAELKEPKWNQDNAEDLVPGMLIEKDPQIENTSIDDVAEYAAIRLTFRDNAGTVLDATKMNKLLSLIKIDWSGKWVRIDANAADPDSAVQIWAYEEIIPVGAVTSPLFYSVKIKDSVTSADIAWLMGDYNHTKACYDFGQHDDADCTITLKHAERCASITSAGVEACDCEPVELHEASCPSRIGTLKADCGCTADPDALDGGFEIITRGGVVQADVFTNLSAAEQALINVFSQPEPAPQP